MADFSKEFESWLKEGNSNGCNPSMWRAWQVAYAAGMTRAAEICDAQWKMADGDECADAIRAEITKGAE